MAFLGIKVPTETARLLSLLDLNGLGEPEPPGFFHVTLLCFDEELPIETIASTIGPVHQVVERTRPFTVSTHRLSCFKPHPEHGTVPIICVVESEALHVLQAELRGALDEVGIEYSKRFPEFKPHVTVGYSKDRSVYEQSRAEREFAPVEWGVHELVLWGGDEGDRRLIVTFPFSLPLTKQALQRSFVHLANRF